jgi:Mce-associated membrane protein
MGTPRLRAALLGGPVLAAALAAGWSITGYTHTRTAANHREQAISAARQALVDFVAVDPKALDKGLGRVADEATGQFRTEFDADRATLRTAYAANKVQATGEVLDAGVVSASADSVTVLLAVEQTVRTAGDEPPRQRHYRVQARMVPRHGRWLVSSLEFVS